MVNCFYYEKSLENDTITILIKLELVNTMPEVYLSAHANTLSKLEDSDNIIRIKLISLTSTAGYYILHIIK